MNYQKLSDEVLLKKINSAINDINKFNSSLAVEGNNLEIKTGYENRSELELDCTKFTQMAKDLKSQVDKIAKEKADAERIEEELRIQKQKDIKEAMDREIAAKMINDVETFNKTKFRFFNLCKYDPEDPYGENKISSPPFFETKEEQFLDELQRNNYKLFEATYTGENMFSKPEYVQKNLNIGFGINITENYTNLYFCNFKMTIKNDTCEYLSYWVSNCKDDVPDFHEFSFTEINDIDYFASKFAKSECDHQVYTR